MFGFSPDVVEPWGSSHGEVSRSPHSPGDAVATPQVVICKCPSENRIESSDLEDLPIVTVERTCRLYMGLIRRLSTRSNQKCGDSWKTQSYRHSYTSREAEVAMGRSSRNDGRWGPKMLECQPRTDKRSVGRPPTWWTNNIKRVADKHPDTVGIEPTTLDYSSLHKPLNDMRGRVSSCPDILLASAGAPTIGWGDW
ncbi:jg1357 [Pararge aegeria aegeria]|uniref:Jg1357 protein n=1 Tax=Pararge aegeria aegeria TaxID=348720 RepID=A0A8S4S2A1_9NEOP|nr:jg1357 [Pararge aegeria aegeria]